MFNERPELDRKIKEAIEKAQPLTIHFHAYVVYNDDGLPIETASGVANETNEIVFATTEFMTSEDDVNTLHFESELYHLPKWCEDNGLTCHIERQSIKVYPPSKE